MLLFSNHLPTLSPLGQAHLHQALFEAIAEEELLPMACLPADPLCDLLHLSESDLGGLIDMLSMRDLAIEIRQIIDTTKLQIIHSTLSKAQSTFLKSLIYAKEPVTFRKMALVRSGGRTSGLAALIFD
jgi:hypothetical protein